jgi:hypothetical protein
MADLPRAAEIAAFHDAKHAVAGWAKSGAPGFAQGIWQAIEDNHRCNCLLWDEEDLARRQKVSDSEIAANKRAIDGFNQRRNDAIERLDEALLAQLDAVERKAGARMSSETAGAMVDRLSILSLKIRLVEQRQDLCANLDWLLEQAARGEAYFKLYRQFKMYNDPALNPAIYGEKR